MIYINKTVHQILIIYMSLNSNCARNFNSQRWFITSRQLEKGIIRLRVGCIIPQIRHLMKTLLGLVSARPRAAEYTIGICKEKAKKPKVSKWLIPSGSQCDQCRKPFILKSRRSLAILRPGQSILLFQNSRILHSIVSGFSWLAVRCWLTLAKTVRNDFMCTVCNFLEVHINAYFTWLAHQSPQIKQLSVPSFLIQKYESNDFF